MEPVMQFFHESEAVCISAGLCRHLLFKLEPQFCFEFKIPEV